MSERSRLNVRWLAWWEVRRTWISYLVSGLFALVLALTAVALLPGAFRVEGLGESGERFARSLNSSYVDFLFLAMVPLLTGNFSSGYYWRVFSFGDPFTGRYAFLRHLPISVRELVASRVLAMLSTLLLTAPTFFLTLYLLSGVVRAELSPVQYPWFVILWLSYGLAVLGLYLYLEVSISGKALNWLILFLTAFFFVLAGTLNFAFSVEVVASSFALVRNHGPLAAGAALLVGVATLVLWARAMERRLGEREFAA